MKEIPLTQGKVALIDDEDFELVNKYKWRIHKGTSGIFYAKTHTPRNGGKQKYITMHRLIMNAKSKQCVDHINHDGLDNRKENLRLCTNAQNQRNQRIKLGGTSKYKGVCWNIGVKKWGATIKYCNKTNSAGYFDNEEDAARAYDKAAKKLFGEFAGLNFPNIDELS